MKLSARNLASQHPAIPKTLTYPGTNRQIMFSGTRFVKKPENCLSSFLQHFAIKRCRFSTLARTPSLKCHRKCKIYSDTSLELIEFDIGTRFLFWLFLQRFSALRCYFISCGQIGGLADWADISPRFHVVNLKRSHLDITHVHPMCVVCLLYTSPSPRDAQ